jgi:hypothetical protein
MEDRQQTYAYFALIDVLGFSDNARSVQLSDKYSEWNIESNFSVLSRATAANNHRRRRHCISI